MELGAWVRLRHGLGLLCTRGHGGLSAHDVPLPAALRSRVISPPVMCSGRARRVGGFGPFPTPPYRARPRAPGALSAIWSE
jgi:hypothetical protein